MSTVIREPVAADAEAIAALHVATWRGLFDAVIPAGPDPGTPGIVEARMVR